MANKAKIIGVLLVITIISMCIAGCTGENPQVPEGNQTVENPGQSVTQPSDQSGTQIPLLTNLEICNNYNCTAGSTRDECLKYC